MEQVNTINAPQNGIYEEVLSFSGCRIELKPLRTDTLTAEAIPQPQLDESHPSPSRSLLLSDIGWSGLEALETRARLAAFEEDWDAPGMEGYDEL